MAGENDVEYAELTQRMIFPNPTPSSSATPHHQILENATSEDSSDLMLMNLFDGVSHSESSSSSSIHSSGGGHHLRPNSSSVLGKMSETALHHPSSSINGANYSSSANLPSSDNNQESAAATVSTASSLPHELAHHTNNILSTSPVWKTQVS